MIELNDLAVDIAKEVGKILLKNFQSGPISFDMKGERDVVTKLDKEMNELIVNRLKENTDYSIISEELPPVKTGSEYTWYVDPIDGTSNFINKVPFFAVSIGLEKNDKVISGVVFNPVLNELFVAESGKGAFLNGNKIKVNNKSNLFNAHLTYLFSWKETDIDSILEVYKKLLPLTKFIKKWGAHSIEVCYTACGRFDGIIIDNTSMWDVGAAEVILEEAGGKFTHIRDPNIAALNDKFIGGNEAIHKLLMEIIKPS